MNIRFEKRLTPTVGMQIGVAVASIVLALLFGAIFLATTGYSPTLVYGKMIEGAFGSMYGFSETIVKMIPLLLCALGISVAFRMQLWNIGAEGQFYMGALATGAVALFGPDLPGLFLIPLLMVVAMIAGGLWGALAGYLKAKWNVNEILSTLMLNYIAMLLLSYFVYGPWRDPKGLNFPLTAPFSPEAMLPAIGATRIHLGLFIAYLVGLILWVLLSYSRWGYEIRVMGSSMKAAEYAGMDRFRTTILVMAISGGIAGLAGMTEVSGVIGKLQPGISAGYGYTAIIIAWLGKLHPAAITIVAFFFGALQVGGYWVQSAGVPATVAAMLQGAILFFVVGGEFLTRYEIQFGKGENA